MFGKKNDFPLPELPDLCLTCGKRASLTPVGFEFRYATAASTLLTLFSPLLGSLYSRGMSYRPKLPVCGPCKVHLKRAKHVAVLGGLLFLPVLLFTALVIIDYSPFFLLTPLIYLVVAYTYHGLTRRRGTPRVMRVNKNELVLNVPNYGELALFERDPGASKAPRRPAPKAAPAGPKLNRSICGDCGFINFVSASECKKCQAPLGRAAAAAF
ncbi:MAG: zinc finger Ran-binding domain-containing family 2 protein [Acidobacteria bacterium]|nr:zinc finger Ran-binding domain-containing family 2 protein [Acidobacteriota bacterium]